MIFIGFGSDTDCDGTSYYIIALNADSVDAAWTFVKNRGSMTTDGIHEIQPAYAVMNDLEKFNVKKRDIFEVIENLFCDEQIESEAPGDERDEVYGYHTTGANWNPWVYDDTIGIPALDTRYEDDYA